ncbi:ATP-binding protein [Streptomyces sp. NPDC048291]|uniref:ATP-binding protein n=1 Tax=Streptomyces sp. NPDC048291 TaxID=3365530 RepID=UPI003720D55B
MGTAMLVGRRREIAVLTGLLDRTPPRSEVLLILGDPGIGKSSLLNEAESQGRDRGFRILRLVGVEAEAGFPFAGLHQMVRPVLDRVSLLPRNESDALSAAFGLAEGPPPEPFLISMAVVNLLAAVAEDEPVLVLADDVQWLDPQSHEVLTFVARRVTGAVVIIAVMRTGHTGPFLNARFPQLDVGGVDDDAAARILADHAPGLGPAEWRRIRDEAHGNPLALRELPVAMTALRPGGGARLVADAGLRPLSLSDRLEHAFAGRGAELPSATRDALLVTAVDPTDDLTEIIAAVSVLRSDEVTPEVFAPAQAVGLVTVRDGRVAFLHPLMRSGVLQAETLARHQSAHSALADVMADPYRRTWHRAQSIVGPDDRIADDLEANAAQALRRGAVIAAITDLERSAQLTSWSARRGHRLLMAAEHAFGLGRGDMVNALLQSAARTDLTDLDRARMEWLREIFDDGIPGDAVRVNELCDIALRSAAAADADLALNLLLGAALRCWWADTGPAARERVADCVDQLPETADDPRCVATLAVAEPVLRVRQVMDALNAADPGDNADVLRVLGMAAHAVGHEALAAELLVHSEMTLREQGRLGLLSQVLSMQVMIHLVLGDLVRAAAAAEEGERLAVETGQPVWRTGTLVCDSVLKALLGDTQEALRLSAEAEMEAARRLLNDLLSCVQLARGAAYLAEGRNRDAYRMLRRAFDPEDPSFHQRERFTSLMFLADAAVRAGHREDARTVVADLELLAQETPSPILHVHLSYARAVLAADEDAEDFYLAALRKDLSSWPYARAKIELAYGSWSRRLGRLDQARSLLLSAQSAFDRIGALPWGDEARLELRATGAPLVWPDACAARFAQITELAALRLTDDEIAEQLSLPTAVVTMYRGGT